MKTRLFIFPLLFLQSSASAASLSGFSTTEIGIMSLFFLLSILLLIVMVTLYAMLKKLVDQRQAKPVKVLENRTLWQKLLSLKPLSMEKQMTMDHVYDGIEELDNPTPPWFMFLFYGTIGIATVYMLVFHVMGDGQVMTVEYAEEIAVAEKQNEAYMAKFANSVNENNVTLLTEEKGLAKGQEIYVKNCVACHGVEGQGGVGPNLTDEYWIHGGDLKSVFHTISEGVAEKGMISWKKTLNPIQIQQLSSYLTKFIGTKPANAKEPQGEKLATK